MKWIGFQLIFGLLTLLASITAQADIAVITSLDSPVSTLTPREVEKIFLGRLRMFPNSDQETLAIDLPDNDPLFVAFYKTIANLDPSKLKRYRAYYLFSGKGRLPISVDNESALIQRVRQNPSAIGYIDSAAVTDEVKVVLIIPTQ